MRVTIFGSGYVGLVTAACLADAGNQLLCVDIDEERVRELNEGRIPIFEPGLEALVVSNLRAGRLEFTTEAARGVRHGLIQLIAVGTPPQEDGSADVTHVLSVARTIGDYLMDHAVVVNKSTVPVGTGDLVHAEIQASLARRQVQVDFDVASNPEFLKEGSAVADFMRPDRIVVGTGVARALDLLRKLYEPFTHNRERVIAMDVRSAELTKYAANAMLATRISFMNELAGLAEQVSADVEMVRIGMGSDPRIGNGFLYAGTGFGGSCFPKDLRALIGTFHAVGCKPAILEAVQEVNLLQKSVLVRKIRQHFGEDLRGRTFGLWGLAYKPNTDDMREAPSLIIAEGLLESGARIRAYDPVAGAKAQWRLADRSGFELAPDAEAALTGADALVIATEWRQFRSPDFELMKRVMKTAIVFDGRNLYDPRAMRGMGFDYHAIGRAVA
ncbi:MAG: UDP-glucose/GDP-mannose dehydrogenase family protein [Steroidobacteraceae bacterium]